MDARSDLIALFDYDLWAWRRWLPFVDRPELRPIVEHVLNSQRVWLERIGGVAELGDDLGQTIESLAAAWKRTIASADLETPVDYVSFRGEPFSETRYHIARHVLNHSTYHRGQIRALAEQIGVADFPDTDLILYLRER